MSNPTFEQVFGSLLRDKGTLESLASAQVGGIELDKADSWLTVRLQFDHFVEFGAVAAAEKAVAAALSLRTAEFLPVYPADSLTEACFPTVVEFLRRRSAAVNGTFNDAEYRLEGDHLTIVLHHGGSNVLKATKTDSLLEQLLREMFGRRITLTLDGETEIDTKSDAYQAMVKEGEAQDAKAAAEAVAHAAAAAPPPMPGASAQAAPKPKAPVNGGQAAGGWLPVYLDTARPLFGGAHSGKAHSVALFGAGWQHGHCMGRGFRV